VFGPDFPPVLARVVDDCEDLPPQGNRKAMIRHWLCEGLADFDFFTKYAIFTIW
jgi:hypothetical protein